MSYTILSAAYGDATNEHAIVQTAEFGAVSISERDRPELWKQMLDGVVAAYSAPVVDIDSIRALYLSKVDADAEATRARYITPGSGMMLTYIEKFAQAQAVHGMGEVDANALDAASREAQFPTLSASMGTEAPTLWACAELVLKRYAAFAALSLVIERARLSGKKSISSASDHAAVLAAYQAVTWPA